MAIRAKLVIIVFVCAILPMFLVTARWSSTAVGSVTASLRASLDERAREVARNIDQTLRTRFAELARLTDAEPMKNYARSLALSNDALPDAQLRTDLGAFLLANRREYISLSCINRQGRALFRVDNGSGPEGGERAYFTDSGFASDEAKHYDEVLKNARPDLPLIFEVEHGADGPFIRVGMLLRHYGLNARLTSLEGNTVGVLMARLRVSQLLREAAGPPGWYAASQRNRVAEMDRAAIILDTGNTVLYAADAKKTGRKFQEVFSDFAPAFASALQSAGRNSGDYDIFSVWGSNWMIRAGAHPNGVAPDEIRAPKLRILAVENHSNVVKDLEFAGFTMYLLTFVLAIVLTLLLYYLISGITDSIRRVTRGARAITAGQLDHRIRVRTSDETKVLADSFNRMAERLREMIARESEQKQFESFARLSAVLTHDLKNSIFSLSLLVQNMERKFDREGFREDAMRTLSNSVTDLQGLVARLSDPLAQSNVRQASDLSAIVERALKRIGENAGARYAISSTLLPRLNANIDARAIERVIENLMINALEAMPDGGSLTVATRVESDAAIVTVADTGKGMTGEFIRERLFRPFATTKKKGIGLGLYSCRDIIEQHGGRIEVSSQPGVGTEFQVILPLEAETEKREPKPHDQGRHDGPLSPSATAGAIEAIAVNER
jgi:signal transduction histidine kinase